MIHLDPIDYSRGPTPGEASIIRQLSWGFVALVIGLLIVLVAT